MGDDDYNSDGSGRGNNYSNHRPTDHVNSEYPTYDQGKDIEVHRDELDRVATELENDLERMRPALDKVLGVGNTLTAQHLGGSMTAAELHAATSRAFTGLTGYYAELRQGYLDVIRRLRLSARSYGEAEDQNTTNAARAADSSAPSSAPPADRSNGNADSTTSNTEAWRPS